MKGSKATMKKLVSLLLTLMMVFAMVPSAFAVDTADKFTDVPSDAWYKSELDYAVFNGYISGTSDTTFSPDGNVTRGQFLTILGRLMGFGVSQEVFSVATNITNPFVDVSYDAYYAPYVIGAFNWGYVNGTSSTTFSPDASITVEQMGTILANYINKEIKVNTDLLVPADAYKDSALISQWARDSMEVMRQGDLLVVDTNGNVNPQKFVTRAECAVTIVRFAKHLSKGEVPVYIPKSATAEEAAARVHDALWAAGKINSTMTQKEKAAVYIEWLAFVCDYDYSFTSRNQHNAYGALVDGLAVCDGYTKAYNLLLMTEGIECSIAETADHAWTTAVLDGVLYHIDATNADQNWGVDYSVFCMTPEEAWEIMNAMQGIYDSGAGVIDGTPIIIIP